MAPITTYSGLLDPDNPPDGVDLRDASTTNYILVETTRPLSRKDYAEMEASSVYVLELMHESNVYRCRYEPPDLATVEKLDFVKQAVIYPQAFVLHWLLNNLNVTDPHPHLLTVKLPDQDGQLLCRVQIYLHEPVRVAGPKFLETLSEMLHEDFDSIEISSHGSLLYLLLPVCSLQAVAAMDEVMTICPEIAHVSHSLPAREVLQVENFGVKKSFLRRGPQQALVSPLNPAGSGETVAVSDSGFDRGLGFFTSKHPAFKGRIANTARTQTIGRTTQTLEDEQPKFPHGTWVAGLVVGNQWNSRQNPAARTLEKSFDMLGTAPGAQVFVQKRFKPPTSTEPPSGSQDSGSSGERQPHDIHDILDNAVSASSRKVKIHNLSYGVPLVPPPSDKPQDPIVRHRARYDASVDYFAFQNAENLIIISAGNEGALVTRTPGSGEFGKADPQLWSNRQIGFWTASMNSLVVGATYSTREMDPSDSIANIPRYNAGETHEGDLGPDGHYKAAYGAYGTEGPGTVCSFSNKGPNPCDYLKPDVVGPGAGLLSAYSLSSRYKGYKKKKASTDPLLYEPNYCYFPQMEFNSGTSGAAPLVSGVAACLRSELRRKGCTTPLAATIRAILINTTRSLRGGQFFYMAYQPPASPTPSSSNTLPTQTPSTGGSGQPSNSTNKSLWICKEGTLGPPPDCVQGFGLVSLRRSLIPVLQAPEATSSAPLGRGWTGYHQVPSSNKDAFTDLNQSWPPEDLFASVNDPKTVVACIPWNDVTKKQLRVTMAYNDSSHSVGALQYDLRLQVAQQILVNGAWKDFAPQILVNGEWKDVEPVRNADPIGDYTFMDAWRVGSQRDVKYGTVQKVTLVGIDGVVGVSMRFQMRVRCHRVPPAATDPKQRIGFSLCWLASADDQF